MPLFDAPPANRTETSQAAAKSIVARAPTIKATILLELRRRGQAGATNDELAGQLGLRLSTVTARVRELAIGGQVIDSGRTRPTTAGCAAIVWITKEAQDRSRSNSVDEMQHRQANPRSPGSGQDAWPPSESQASKPGDAPCHASIAGVSATGPQGFGPAGPLAASYPHGGQHGCSPIAS